MSDSTQTGPARERVRRSRRQIAEQHASLDRLQTDVQRSLEHGDADGIRSALRALTGSVEAHFELEEHAYYPAADQLSAGQAQTLEALLADHEHLRAELDDLEHALDHEDVPGLRTAYSIFATALADHETREEKLMEEVASERS